MHNLLKILCLLFVIGVNAQQSVEYIHDKEGTFDFSTIQSQSFHTVDDTNRGLNNGLYWFKIPQIDNPREMLSISSNHTGDLILKDSTGQIIPLMSNTRYPSFFLIDRIHEFPLYLRANFEYEAFFPIEILEESEYIATEKYDLLGTGVFYGAIVSLIFATMVFFFITRNKVFLFHALLAAVVALTIIAKDNLFYLAHLDFPQLVYFELLSHFCVGFFGFCFAYYYLKLQSKSFVQKAVLGSLIGMSAIAMFIYFFTSNMLFYFISDVFTLLTITGVWIIGIAKSKNTRLNWFIGMVYLFNIYLMLEVFVLHSSGQSFLGLSTLAAKICVIIDVVLITFAMMYTFKKLQLQSSLMKQQIKTYLQRIETLDQYKKVQDADDSYLESLIHQFGLANSEVKVLQGISKGHTNEHIAADFNMSREDVEKTTKSLYMKLGIEADQEIRMLVT